MTDRIIALTVYLDREYRDDDAKSIIDAILMTRGVSKVEAHIVTAGDSMNTSAALWNYKNELIRKLLKELK